jgi:hypothetical protein
VIFVHDKSVLPNTVALVYPQASNVKFFTFVFLSLRTHDVLNDLGKVTHVELIEELLGSGRKLGVLAHVQKDFLCSTDDFRSQFLDFLVEFTEMRREHLTVDRAKNLLFWYRKANSSQVTSETHIDKEGTGLGIHA